VKDFGDLSHKTRKTDRNLGAIDFHCQSSLWDAAHSNSCHHRGVHSRSLVASGDGVFRIISTHHHLSGCGARFLLRGLKCTKIDCTGTQPVGFVYYQKGPCVLWGVYAVASQVFSLLYAATSALYLLDSVWLTQRRYGRTGGARRPPQPGVFAAPFLLFLLLWLIRELDAAAGGPP
jgi:hypothetical protein